MKIPIQAEPIIRKVSMKINLTGIVPSQMGCMACLLACQVLGAGLGGHISHDECLHDWCSAECVDEGYHSS